MALTLRSTPVLSVLVPSYNYGAFIDEALQSVLDQSVDGVEVIVVDDGSTDDTPQRMLGWAEHPAVESVRQENAGVSAARNHAMSRARGRYLMFLDADDLLIDGCIRTTIDFMDRFPEVGFFFTNYDIFDERGVVDGSGVDIWKVFRSLPHRVVDSDAWCFEGSLTAAIIRHGGFMHTSGLTLRREVAQRAGPFREGFSYGEDDEFYARAAHQCTAGYVDRVLSRKRNHPHSLIHVPGNAIRKARQLLELSEIQRAHYADDAEIQAVLQEKIHACVVSCAWGLLEESRTGEALDLLKRYLPRYPRSWTLHKLSVRALGQKLARRDRPAPPAGTAKR